MQTSVDFSQHVKEVLNRNNTQIRSLEFVDTRIREEFTQHRKKAILLIRNKVYEREINPLDARTIDVFDTQLSTYLKKGQLVLVVLPTGGVKRYVLQTSIANIYIDRFRLVALDPRNSRRFSFSHAIAVGIRPVADATVIRIQTGEVRAIRHCAGLPPELSHPSPSDRPGQVGGTGLSQEPAKVPPVESSGGTGEAAVAGASIKDLLGTGEGAEPADDFVTLAGQPALAAELLDISCGGMCLSCRHEAGEHLFIDQLLAVDCVLAKGGTLFLFAIVRNIKKHLDETRCNLQFLADLPRAMQEYW